MATRTFCDHCGLKIPNAKKFYFGKYHDNEGDAQQVMVGVGHMQQGVNQSQMIKAAVQQQVQIHSKPSERYYPTIVVDLCDVCTPIWYERACNLTKATKVE